MRLSSVTPRPNITLNVAKTFLLSSRRIHRTAHRKARIHKQLNMRNARMCECKKTKQNKRRSRYGVLREYVNSPFIIHDARVDSYANEARGENGGLVSVVKCSTVTYFESSLDRTDGFL